MKRFIRTAKIATSLALLAFTLQFANPPLSAKRRLPQRAASAKSTKNPYQGQDAEAGRPLYQNRCAACHGPAGEGSGNIPSLTAEKAQSASDGELFWYVTKGDLNNGMPSWEGIPEKERWQIINFLRVLGGSKPGSPRVRLSAEEAVATAAKRPRRNLRSPTIATRSPASLARSRSPIFPNRSLRPPRATARKLSRARKMRGRKSPPDSKSNFTPAGSTSRASFAPLPTAISLSPKAAKVKFSFSVESLPMASRNKRKHLRQTFMSRLELIFIRRDQVPSGFTSATPILLSAFRTRTAT